MERKLAGYAALAAASGVAMLALAENAEAKVIYTATHQKITGNQTLSLDVNGDGIVDFKFVGYTFLGGARAPIHKTYTFNSDGELFVQGAVASNEALGLNGGVSALAAGVKVGGSGNFAASHFFLGVVSATDGEPPIYYGAWAPEGGNVKGKYVGLKFVINGEIHYGWARFDVQIRPPLKGDVQAVLTGYAYQTDANTPIITGETSGPGDAGTQKTVGQLALGAAGR